MLARIPRHHGFVVCGTTLRSRSGLRTCNANLRGSELASCVNEGDGAARSRGPVLGRRTIFWLSLWLDEGQRRVAISEISQDRPGGTLPRCATRASLLRPSWWFVLLTWLPEFSLGAICLARFRKTTTVRTRKCSAMCSTTNSRGPDKVDRYTIRHEVRLWRSIRVVPFFPSYRRSTLLLGRGFDVSSNTPFAADQSCSNEQRTASTLSIPTTPTGNVVGMCCCTLHVVYVPPAETDFSGSHSSTNSASLRLVGHLPMSPHLSSQRLQKELFTYVNRMFGIHESVRWSSRI